MDRRNERGKDVRFVTRVLVVADEIRVAAALRRGLHTHGFVVDVATDGVEGLSMASERRFDAIILDVKLPGVDGSKVCRELRDAGNWTPVLMVTTTSGEDGEAEAEALNSGADDLLFKPFSIVAVVARLRALLRRGGRTRPAVLDVAGLRLDPASHQVWRGDSELVLTRREFAVLEFLLRRAGEVVSKTEILEAVWDYEFDGDPNNVEVYVGRLRHKIDEPFGTATITTVRGAGYRIGAPR